MQLNAEQLERLCEAAPSALAMAARIPRDRDWSGEMAAAFRLSPAER